MVYIIRDWAGNKVNTGDTSNAFKTFEDALGWLYELCPDAEDLNEFYVDKE